MESKKEINASVQLRTNYKRTKFLLDNGFISGKLEYTNALIKKDISFLSVLELSNEDWTKLETEILSLFPSDSDCEARMEEIRKYCEEVIKASTETNENLVGSAYETVRLINEGVIFRYNHILSLLSKEIPPFDAIVWLSDNRYTADAKGKYEIVKNSSIEITSSTYMKVWQDGWVIYFGKIPTTKTLFISLLNLLNIPL